MRFVCSMQCARGALGRMLGWVHGLPEQEGSPAPASEISQGGSCAFGCRAEARHCLNNVTVVLYIPPNSSCGWRQRNKYLLGDLVAESLVPALTPCLRGYEEYRTSTLGCQFLYGLLGQRMIQAGEKAQQLRVNRDMLQRLLLCPI